ncbi:uncharacterized protein N0V89_011426 [Didymosphaeria variabile]|uniref:Probable treble clef zinc finger fungi domain-containing protein n=1 Tax=Didymosphaeria variabile TaxID=1932322 RepID=A0A9W8X9T0_9PLEO|nr:uncharacterized protein N0V89_011426 [Didymosphaeria variabile]KAJ4345296.1 hypothetical protein N0V89_011426 [Didymosphaeria variabile]
MRYLQIPAGNCQAIGECGRRCDRLANANPPFHFCDWHANGTDTLPCYLLGLPAELRDMIWRHVLPETISGKLTCQSYRRGMEGKKANKFSLLFVNLQISKEVLAVAYEQVPFEVDVDEYRTIFCGNHLESPSPWQRARSVEGSIFDLAVTGRLLPVLKRVRNFRITVTLGSHQETPRGCSIYRNRQSITVEDYHVFHTRERLRKFIDLIRPGDSAPRHADSGNFKLRGLDLLLQFGEQYNWGFHEVLSMVIMAAEPFKALGNVQKPALHDIVSLPSNPARPDSDADAFKTEYQAYKLEWQKSMMQISGEAPASSLGFSQSKIDKIRKELRKVEQFISLLLKQNFTGTYGHDMWDDLGDQPFSNIARVLHLARVASEQLDVDRLAKIREVLLQRWIDYQGKQEQKSNALSESLLDMFQGNKKPKAFREQREKLTATKWEPRDIDFDWEWPELDAGRFVGNRISPEIPPDVTVTEDRQYRHFSRDGRQWAVLKTPLFVRNKPTRTKPLD